MVFSVAFFIWGYSFLKGKNMFVPVNNYYVLYEKVGGLIESGHVMMSGYKIGFVDDIRFTDDMNNLVVRVSIDKKIELPRGTVAKIFSSDIMGTRAVEIIPGSSGEKHFPGDTLYAQIQPDLKEEINIQILPLKLRAEEMMASVDSLLIIFQSVLDQSFRDNFAKSVENLTSTIGSLERSVYSVDTLLTLENSRFNRILGHLESVSGNLAGSNQDISNILNNFSAISDSISKSELLSSINNLNELLTGINQGEGSLGKLFNDDELYNNLEDAVKSLDLLLTDLKDRPGRYVNFSIFGRKQE